MKKLAIIITCVGVALCLGVAAFFFLKSDGSGQQPTLYYNLDGFLYQNPSNTALSNRTPDGKGVYHIDFAVGGEKVTYTTTDPKMVDLVDFMQVAILTVSEEGEIRSASWPATPVSREDTIQQIGENALTLNTSIAYNGGQKTLQLAEGCRFYDLSSEGALTQPEIMDEILAYGNDRGEATDVFIVRRLPQTKLYWRLNRKFDARANATIREAGDDGVYTIPFAVEGERVELKCKDWEVVCAVDRPDGNNSAMGLVLDEQGYITQVLPGYRALRGREICNQFNITAIDGDKLTLVNKQKNSVYGYTCYATLGENCNIYNVSSGAQSKGQVADSVQVGDRVTVFSDPMGIATNIYVHIRKIDSPVYFNLMQMYVSGSTARIPDAQGYYTFRMVRDGEIVDLKTKDKKIANSVDAISSRTMGLVLEGDVIKQVVDVSCVTGETAMVIGRYVHSFTAAMIAHTNQRGTGLSPLMLNADCKYYDVTGNAKSGAMETTLRKGDRFIAVGNEDGLATHVFILGRK